MTKWRLLRELQEFKTNPYKICLVCDEIVNSLERAVESYKKEIGIEFEDEVRNLTKKYVNIVEYGKLEILGKKWELKF